MKKDIQKAFAKAFKKHESNPKDKAEDRMEAKKGMKDKYACGGPVKKAKGGLIIAVGMPKGKGKKSKMC